jgi:3-hydroxy acid dehydrogenase/malonic semialdehyde reductase
MRIAGVAVADNSGLVKGIDNVGDIAEDDVKVMFDTNVTGLINVYISLPV